MLRSLPAVAVAAVMVASLAPTPRTSADVIRVTILGEVEYNQVGAGPLAAAAAGNPASITFDVDSNTFTNNPGFPTRGYAITPGTFTITMGAATASLGGGPGTPSFVLRNNDPAVDGFFLSTDLDGPIGVPLDVPGVLGPFTANFNVTYPADRLASLDIHDAIGTHDFAGLSVFNMTVSDGPFDPIGMIYERMTIELIPAPGTAILIAVAAATLTGRRRRGACHGASYRYALAL